MLKDFKPALNILFRFIIIYLVMLFLYQLYLKQFSGLGLDGFSKTIAKQVMWLQNKLGYSTELYHDAILERDWFYVNKVYVSYMVEGCNAVSVMILFAAFVFAFYKGVKTFGFVIIGLLLLYFMNILRITGLNIVLREYPELGKTVHDYIFPSIIYGFVVVFWLVWIQVFVLKNDEKV